MTVLAIEKVAAAFLSLPGFLVLSWIIITAYLLLKGRSFLIKMLSILTLILLVIISTGLGVRLLVIPLETMYSTGETTASYPIVVLGGGVNHLAGGEASLSLSTLQRVVRGYQLYLKTGGPLVMSGGVALGQQGLSEARVAGEWLEGMGVPAGDIVLDKEARTTYENGVYVREWLEEEGHNRVYLVTSAIHLPRSVQVFRRQGVRVIPVAAGYLVDHRQSWLNYLPNRGAVAANLAAAHEWVGMVWYRLQGRI